MNKGNVLTGLFKVGLKKFIKPKAELWLQAWGQTAPKISQNKLKKTPKLENQPPKTLKELLEREEDARGLPLNDKR